MKERRTAGSKAPLYRAGETYYLSSKSGAPAKIFVEAVYIKPASTQWMYCIRSEANNCHISYVPESVLRSRISRHTGKVYENKDVIKRYAEGFRFAGNHDVETAMKKGYEFAKNDDISSVMLYPALDSCGNSIEDQYGVWIMWKYKIYEGGDISRSQSVIKIK